MKTVKDFLNEKGIKKNKKNETEWVYLKISELECLLEEYKNTSKDFANVIHSFRSGYEFNERAFTRVQASFIIDEHGIKKDSGYWIYNEGNMPYSVWLNMEFKKWMDAGGDMVIKPKISL